MFGRILQGILSGIIDGIPQFYSGAILVETPGGIHSVIISMIDLLPLKKYLLVSLRRLK